VNVGNVGTLKGINSFEEIPWPDNSPFGVCLTHDVDRVKMTYQYLTHSIKSRSLRPLLTKISERVEPYWQFENIMHIEREYGVRSTFFFLNESFRFNPLRLSTWPLSLGRYDIKSNEVVNIIKKLDEAGWEIGLHGSVRSYNNGHLLLREKQILEGILGHKVNGTRQHWLNLEIPATWIMHQEIGLRYDTSFGYKYDVGFKDNIYHPFTLEHLDNFVVFPLSIMDTFLFSKYANYEDALSGVKKIIDMVEKQHGVLCVLWHQMVFYENIFPNHVVIYKKMIEECKKRGAWFGTCSQAYDLVIQNT